MLDEKDLQAIDLLIQKRITESEERIAKSTAESIYAAEQRIAKSTVALMDAEFSKKFNLLAEGQEAILERLVPRSRVDDLEDEVKFLKSIVRQLNEDMQALKKAN